LSLLALLTPVVAGCSGLPDAFSKDADWFAAPARVFYTALGVTRYRTVESKWTGRVPTISSALMVPVLARRLTPTRLPVSLREATRWEIPNAMSCARQVRLTMSRSERCIARRDAHLHQGTAPGNLPLQRRAVVFGRSRARTTRATEACQTRDQSKARDRLTICGFVLQSIARILIAKVVLLAVKPGGRFLRNAR